MFTFEIEGKLPGLNEIIKAYKIPARNNGHPGALGAIQKSQETDRVCQWIMVERVPIFNDPISLTIHWVEPDARRDIDNVAAGTKFILDALVKTKRIQNDSRRYVRQITHIFPVPNPARPHVTVMINPITKG